MRCVLLLILIGLPADWASADTVFRDHWDQAWRGETRPVREALSGPMAEHPLRAYLEYAILQQPAQADDDSIAAFLARHPETPLADRLRRYWLDELARSEQWGRYIAFWRPNLGTRYDCRQLRAWLDLPKALRPVNYSEQVRDLWLVPHSQPDSCDPVFRHWFSAMPPDESIVWQRIEMAIEANEIRLARYLQRHLPENERERIQAWLAMRSAPERQLPKHLGDDHPRAPQLIRFGFQRLLGNDPERLLDWLSHPVADRLSNAERQRLHHRAVLLQHTRFVPEADALLAQLPAEQRSQTLLAWSVRQALRRQDWQQVIQRIDRLSAAEQEDEVWRYWRAVARLAIEPGDPAAEQVLANLAGEVSYYGFMAADRLGRDYALCTTSGEDIQARAPNPAIARALLLHQAGLIQHARREWRYGMAGLDDTAKTQAAILADRAGWHHAAILGLADAGAWHDYPRRFPVLFDRAVREAAARNGLNPAFVMAIIRAESAFQTDARSPADALGLMQLTEPTARALARRSPALHYRNRWQLIDADTNIAFGAFYLRRLFDRFGPDYWAVIAGYNAGPTVAQQWLRDTRGQPTDVILETLPYHETRQYVQRVAAFSVIYEWRLGREINRVSARLQAGTGFSDRRLANTASSCPALPERPDADELITASLIQWSSDSALESAK